MQAACCTPATTWRRASTEERHIAAPTIWTIWESAFDSYYVELCDYVLRFVGSAEAAQDIVQDLFVRLWDTRGPRDGRRLTRPYLFVAARYANRRGEADVLWIPGANREASP